MARLVKRTLTLQGRQESGPVACPCCKKDAKILAYPEGEEWSTLICPQCGWYQVPTMNAHPRTEFDVVVYELVERKTGGKK